MIFKTLVIILLIGIGCDTTNIYYELKKIRDIKDKRKTKLLEWVLRENNQ